MALDHGTLNIPLSKRGDIDAQIDRYKADQARDQRNERKARNNELAAQRLVAKGLVAHASSERIIELALKNNVTPVSVRQRLKSDAHWQPEKVIALLSPKAQ